MQPLLDALLTGRHLTSDQADSLLGWILAGEVDPAVMGATLALLHARGPNVDELVGGARAMRRHVTPVPLSPAEREELIDTCGTGGAPKLFNVSTAAALVAAGAGARVVKHGNRSRTGRGSAEILQTLGVNVDASPEVQARCVREAGLCFCFAIHHHPAIKHAMPVRRALGFPTIFNLLGPLTNPGGAARQLLGVAQATHVELVAGALLGLGCSRAIVAHTPAAGPTSGYDELVTTGPVLLAHVKDGTIVSEKLDPASLGLARPDPASLQADTLDAAANLMRAVLAGQAGPTLDVVVLNAAAALLVAGRVDSWQAGLAMARESVGSGAARRTLDVLVRVSNTG